MAPELEMVSRLLLAAVLGMVVGWERLHARKSAGLRTHMLVCIGSALFTVVSIYGFGEGSDPARVAAGVVAGIGFIGAGAIIHREGGLQGLTTAASIWAVSAIGLAAGAGMYILAPVAAAIVLIVLMILKKVEQ